VILQNSWNQDTISRAKKGSAHNTSVPEDQERGAWEVKQIMPHHPKATVMC
jgi:hypothetical protein